MMQRNEKGTYAGMWRTIKDHPKLPAPRKHPWRIASVGDAEYHIPLNFIENADMLPRREALTLEKFKENIKRHASYTSKTA